MCSAYKMRLECDTILITREEKKDLIDYDYNSVISGVECGKLSTFQIIES